ncbi:hypothetical protein JVX91_26980 [Pseudomonas sp. PDNC002]|uniref:hypothetical protein n=1 Tax=Pseudomonas sp. PDNC002 TaxID=2811422 RepID=UPI00196325DC|nr:hypothetical protein [Pseudomonas sp. PDNC002]QRY79170.1 hypothetical protein JVX91_26980 [Pseudomonas sp. PDNC002]
MTPVDSNNLPFQPPAALLLQAPAAAEKPPFRLAAIGIAGFFGTPLAGAWVMARSFERLGRHDLVRKAWTLGIGLFLAVNVLALILPGKTSFTPINLMFAAGMQHHAKQLIGPTLEAHLAAGGTVASNWRAFGVSLLFSLAVIAVIFGGAFVLALFGLI